MFTFLLLLLMVYTNTKQLKYVLAVTVCNCLLNS